MLLDAELIERNGRRTDRLMKNTTFHYHASIEQLRFDSSRGLDKSVITSLLSCDFIKEGSSVIITGATGLVQPPNYRTFDYVGYKNK